MEETLDTLIKIQHYDEEIHDTRTRIEEIPRRTSRLEQEIQNAGQELEERKSHFADVRKNYKMKEGDIAENEGKIEKLNGQIFAVKTNEEYRAILNEIDFLKKENKHIEDEMLSLLEEEETLKGTLDAFETDTRKYIDERKERIAILNTEMQTLDEQLKSVRHRFEDSFLKLPEEVQALYEKIEKVRGNVVCVIKDDSCTGCSSILTPQFLNELKKRNEILLCDNCGRILVYTDRKSAA